MNNEKKKIELSLTPTVEFTKKNKRKYDGLAIAPTIITSVDTLLGYMQVLEYELQDFSYLHIVQWYYNSDIDLNTELPRQNSEIFYRDRVAALEFAHKVGCNLLEQFL